MPSKYKMKKYISSTYIHFLPKNYIFLEFSSIPEDALKKKEKTKLDVKKIVEKSVYFSSRSNFVVYTL